MSYECVHENCSGQVILGVQGTKLGVFCPAHTREDVVEACNVPSGQGVHGTAPRCGTEECFKRSNNGTETNPLGNGSAQQATTGMTSVVPPSSEKKGDRNVASYQANAHTQDKSVSTERKLCEYEGCNAAAKYKPEGRKEKKAFFCAQHAPEGMVKVQKARRCREEGCGKYPGYAFGEQGKGSGVYCAQHAPEGMVSTRKRSLCIGESCTRSPSFAVEGSKGAVFCSQHAKEGMVNVKNRTCALETCRTQPSYGQFYFIRIRMVGISLVQFQMLCLKKCLNKCSKQVYRKIYLFEFLIYSSCLLQTRGSSFFERYNIILPCIISS